MGTENPGRPSFPARPASTPFAAAQTMTQFPSTNTVGGSEPPPFRPPPPAAPQTSSPFSSLGPVVGPAASTFRPTPPARFNDPSVPPPPPPTSSVPPATGHFQRLPTPPFSSTVQPPPSRAPPMGQPSVQPFASQPPPFQAPLQPQPQTPFVSMGSPPHATPAPSSNIPPPVFQPSFPGHASKQTGAEMPLPTPMHSSFPTNQGNYGTAQPPPPPSQPFLSHQGGYAPQPPMAAPLGIQPMQHPGSGPPIGSIQGLVEDFSSLSIQTRPGTMDPVIDAKELPRPLDGDLKPESLADMYPMNCNPRFLRLTTSGIPSSQSLASRWHLPLGAVICPLAEALDGVSTSIPSLIRSYTYC